MYNAVMFRYRLPASIIFACLIVVIIGTRLVHSGPKLHTFIQPPASPTSPPPASPLLNPLSIAAVRAHPPPGGKITVENEIASRGGCRTFVVSYPSDGYTL